MDILYKLSGSLALIAVLTGCSGDSGVALDGSTGGSGPGTSGGIFTATLSWTPPTTNNDGTSLPVGEIDKYRVYISRTANQFDGFVELDATSNPSSYSFALNDAGIEFNTTYFIAMSTVNSQGQESDLSQSITFTPN